MGAENSNSQNKRFVNIFEGKFAFRVKENTPGAICRTNKNQKEVWEMHYDTLTNMRITKIQKVESKDYGFGWEVTLREADDVMVLNLPYSGRTTNGLFFRLPNLNLGLPLTLKAFNIEREDKPGSFRAFITVEQGGKKVEPAFTKENANGLPQLEEITLNGKKTWDATKQMAFIEKMLNEAIIPKLQKLNEDPIPPASSEPGEQYFGDGQDVDDLPF